MANPLHFQTSLFIRFGGTFGDDLVPAKIVATEDDMVHLTVTASDLDPEAPVETPDLEPGQSLTVYFQGHREFMQQPAGVVDIIAEAHDDQPVIVLRLIGSPASAESREYYRENTALQDLVCTVDGRQCMVLDLSMTGMAFMSTRDYDIGTKVEVTFPTESAPVTGEVVIQSIKKTPLSTRYGSLTASDHRSRFSNHLRTLTMEVQRTKLRRKAGAA